MQFQVIFSFLQHSYSFSNGTSCNMSPWEKLLTPDGEAEGGRFTEEDILLSLPKFTHTNFPRRQYTFYVLYYLQYKP